MIRGFGRKQCSIHHRTPNWDGLGERVGHHCTPQAALTGALPDRKELQGTGCTRHSHFPRRVESTMMHLHRLYLAWTKTTAQAGYVLPSMLSSNRKDVQVQSPKTEIPLASVAIGALEVGASGLCLRWNVPAPASLVCDEREMIVIGNIPDKEGICFDRAESIRHREC